jgi:hypothetical protein
MCPEPIHKLKSESTSQERGATGSSLDETKAAPALSPERPKLRSNILPNTPTPDMSTAAMETRLAQATGVIDWRQANLLLAL